MDPVVYDPIGIIHTPFTESKGTPIQPTAGKGIRGSIEILPEYVDGLKDLEGFSHIILLFHLHLISSTSSTPSPSYASTSTSSFPSSLLRATPFLDDEEHGIFSIRGPNRPNTIGLSIVRLIGIEGNILHIQDLDILDGTPLLDIKPYIPSVDERGDVKIGWLEGKIDRFTYVRDDGRFSP